MDVDWFKCNTLQWNGDGVIHSNKSEPGIIDKNLSSPNIRLRFEQLFKYFLLLK